MRGRRCYVPGRAAAVRDCQASSHSRLEGAERCSLSHEPRARWGAFGDRERGGIYLCTLHTLAFCGVCTASRRSTPRAGEVLFNSCARESKDVQKGCYSQLSIYDVFFLFILFQFHFRFCSVFRFHALHTFSDIIMSHYLVTL